MLVAASPTPQEVLDRLPMKLHDELGFAASDVVFCGLEVIHAVFDVLLENKNPFPVELLSTRVMVCVPGAVSQAEIGHRGLLAPGAQRLLQFAGLVERSTLLQEAKPPKPDDKFPCLVYVRRIVRSPHGYAEDPAPPLAPGLRGSATISLDHPRFEAFTN